MTHLTHLTHIIGITGGIGSGKSVVARLLRCRGFRVYDCDSRARVLMENSEQLKQILCCRFGSESLLVDGSLNRTHLAKHVFSCDEHRLWLNEQVHGMVRDDIAAEAVKISGTQASEISCAKVADSMSGTHQSLLFVESAIMKSSNLDAMCDAVWLVTAPLELRIARVTARDACDMEHVMHRMNAQNAEFVNFDVPVYEITNDDVSPLLPQIDNLLNLL